MDPDIIIISKSFIEFNALYHGLISLNLLEDDLYYKHQAVV